MNCPLCTSSRSRLTVGINGQEIRRCAGCSVLFTAPPLSEEELSGLYNTGYYAPDGNASRFRFSPGDTAARFFRTRRASFLRRAFGDVNGKRVLDVGCERGYMLRALQQQGAEVYGTQISKPAAEFARTELGLKNIFDGDLLEANYPDGFFDCVALYHVLEHLSAPLVQLQEIRRILKPGGLLYIEVPNAGSASARMFGKFWLAYDLPRHRFHFEPGTLQELVERAGFECIDNRWFSAEYSPATLTFSAVSALFRSENSLFDLLTENKRKTKPDASLLLQGVAAALLLLPATVISLLLAAGRSGDTMGVLCRS